MFPKLCPACDYDLSGLLLDPGSVCPECGGRVDSAELRIREEALYKRKVFTFALAAAAPWIGPVVMLIGAFKGALAEYLGTLGEVVALFGPIVGVFLLYAAFRLDVRQEQRSQSPWGDAMPSVLLMALYTLCVWVVIGVVALFVTLPGG